MTRGSVMKLMTLIVPPQRHTNESTSYTRLISRLRPVLVVVGVRQADQR